MKYKIEEIEGIGPAYGKILTEAGIADTATLLERCGSRSGRSQVAKATGLKEPQLLKWANLADLMRISGIGSEYSELLEAAGVDTIKELRQRKPEHLAAMIKEINLSRKLTRVIPSETQVAQWIDQAKGLEPSISH